MTNFHCYVIKFSGVKRHSRISFPFLNFTRIQCREQHEHAVARLRSTQHTLNCLFGVKTLNHSRSYNLIKKAVWFVALEHEDEKLPFNTVCLTWCLSAVKQRLACHAECHQGVTWSVHDSHPSLSHLFANLIFGFGINFYVCETFMHCMLIYDQQNGKQTFDDNSQSWIISKKIRALRSKWFARRRRYVQHEISP